MSSENESPASKTPVWSTGPEQVEVKLVVTGETYNVDTDIAKRMGFIQEGVKFESPFGLTGCSKQDFELALVFCAEDRSCVKPPSKELAHIISETAAPSVVRASVSPEPEPASEASTSEVQKAFADIAIADDEDDEEDGSYLPSESESSDSDEEYSDTDTADLGAAGLQAELEEHEAREKEKRSLGL
ncbi:hypothetical protein RSOLAG1IB_09943 [Rhizoctonia solani AG-1 IB]|uniref:Uncharacterized protein n=1 Tax=Thanatephorus cucumeris (strain AG1-IB / isolate 7/3/14) TaxID=1108050 RepID=A0A0B7FUE2_THACB|nr:hypothetical protein RSOLAG1IB_09943 [Rhizoctonia solani AG-1 IB]